MSSLGSVVPGFAIVVILGAAPVHPRGTRTRTEWLRSPQHIFVGASDVELSGDN